MLAHKVHFAHTGQIYLRQYLPVGCTESIKKRNKKVI